MSKWTETPSENKRSRNKRFFSRSKRITSAVIVFLIIGLVIFAFFMKEKSSDSTVTPPNNKNEAQAVCSEDIIKQSAPLLQEAYETGIGTELESVTQDIKAKKDYKQDPNCLYILLQSNLATTSDSQNDELLADLEKIASLQFHSLFNEYPALLTDIDQLKIKADFIKKSNKMITESSKKSNEQLLKIIEGIDNETKTAH